MAKNPSENYQRGSETSQESKQKRDAEERAIKEKNLDKTIADSFPTSDPPSTIPNPGEDEDAA